MTLVCRYLAEGVAFGEPYRGPCVARAVVDVIVGYYEFKFLVFSFFLFNNLAVCILAELMQRPDVLDIFLILIYYPLSKK